MTASARRGISDHRLVEHFERFVQRFRGPFWRMSELEAQYQAAYCCLRLAGLTHEQAQAHAKDVIGLT